MISGLNSSPTANTTLTRLSTTSQVDKPDDHGSRGQALHGMSYVMTIESLSDVITGSCVLN